MRILSTVCVFVLALALGSCSDAPTTSIEVESGTITAAAAKIVMPAPGTFVLGASGKGAVRHIPDPECGVLDEIGEFFLVDCRNQIATYSRNGNALAVVQASGVPNLTGEVVHWDAYNPGIGLIEGWAGTIDEPPYPCLVLGPEPNWETGADLLFTVKWSAVLTPSGQATFSCHYSDKWAYQW